MFDDQRYCSRCGKNEEDTEWQKLFEIHVEVEPGEEGFAHVIQLLCDTCGPDMVGALRSLGFIDHHHGGINYLESECVADAYNNCPINPKNVNDYPYGYIVQYKE